MKYSTIFEILKQLEIHQGFGLKIVSGIDLAGKHALLHQPDENAIYEFESRIDQEDQVIKWISSIYPDDYTLTIIRPATQGEMVYQTATAENLKLQIEKFEGGYIFFPAEPSLKSLDVLIELIAHLRAPEGCPWDRKQTHATLRTNLLEETYEVLESLDEGDADDLKEELGDLLLQIILHAQIASEEGEFNIFEVIGGIYQKIVYRHPHVFGDWSADDASAVLLNWEILKSREREAKNQPTKKNLLDSVPKSLPALSLAQKYQERAARVGFDWPDIAPVIEKIEEEIQEVKEAPDATSRERELGDVLFALVNLIRWYGLDAESVLRKMNQRFLKRFSFIEKCVVSQGRQMTDLTLAELDGLWEQAKQEETKSV